MGYLGSKAASGAYQAIIALMPPHDTFIDLFVGSGAIMERKPRAPESCVVDLNAEVLEKWKGIPDVHVHQQDAIQFLHELNWTATGRTLVYADPPYLHSTRTSRHRYDFEMTDADHVALLSQLRGPPKNVNVILSGYPSTLYNDHLPEWNTREFQSMTRGGPRTEKLWFNFECAAVQWGKFAGRNFGERQRIKRKAARWAANYRELPPGERLAVLSALLAVDGLQPSHS